MIDQLSFLDWKPPPELMVKPPVRRLAPKPRNLHRLIHPQVKLRVYQKGKSRLLQLNQQDNRPHRHHEILRLDEFIADCKHQIKEEFHVN